ncbi:hypothetical protein H8959_007772, partial [Pygathrix nigripes]
CLLEEGLCGASEACVNDGVFGRCQKVPAMDFYRYEVSPVALQRLRVALQKLSGTGTSCRCSRQIYCQTAACVDFRAFRMKKEGKWELISQPSSST